MRKWLEMDEMGENLSSQTMLIVTLGYDLTAKVSNTCVEGKPPQSKLSASLSLVIWGRGHITRDMGILQ